MIDMLYCDGVSLLRGFSFVQRHMAGALVLLIDLVCNPSH